jgi:hypothetical protein
LLGIAFGCYFSCFWWIHLGSSPRWF